MLSGFDNPFHILLILVVVLLVFGAKRLPELGRSLGSSMHEFRAGISGADSTGRETLPAARDDATKASDAGERDGE